MSLTHFTPSIPLAEPFGESTDLISKLRTEEDVIRYAGALTERIRTFFTRRNFHLAEYCLDFLLEKKGSKKRRDQHTPDYLHELRQVVAVIAFEESGVLNGVPLKHPYGNIELLYCATLIHDLGEDFNLLPDDLMVYLQTRIAQEPDIVTSQQQRDYENAARRIANIMELMTMERKYPESEIRRRIGKQEGALTPEDLERFTHMLERKSTSLINTPESHTPLEIIPYHQKKGVYVVSRNIVDGLRDWNSYIHNLIRDPFAILGKFLDRNEGLSTRIGPTFSIPGYARYLSMTEQTFRFDRLAAAMQDKYPHLREAFVYAGAMLDILYRIGRAYVNHHKDFNGPGDKGFSISRMTPVNFDNEIRVADHRVYDLLPDGLHPLAIILSRVRTSDGLGSSAEPLYNAFVQSLHAALEKTKRTGILPGMRRMLRPFAGSHSEPLPLVTL